MFCSFEGNDFAGLGEDILNRHVENLFQIRQRSDFTEAILRSHPDHPARSFLGQHFRNGTAQSVQDIMVFNGAAEAAVLGYDERICEE